MKKILITLVCLCGLTSNAQIIRTVAGNGVSGTTGNGGMATAAATNYPGDVVVDANGNIYFSEHFNDLVRKVSPSGILTTVAGNGTQGFSGDGGPATDAELYNPYGLALDTFGNLYISDCWNYRIRKVTPAGIITTIAGTGSAGYNGDGIAATTAKIWNPNYICTDISGNVYITDNQNQRIRKVDRLTGLISTYVGNGTVGYFGDGGPATAAMVNYPGQISMDIHGTLYIADAYNYVVRKVSSSGIISTIGGTGSPGFSGDGGPATLAQMSKPLGLCADNFGNVYFSDWDNYRIRKISATGTISTITGNGTAAYSGDGGPAIDAEVNQMDGIHFSNAGNLFIADAFNYRIRTIMYDTHTPTFAGGHHQSFSVCEDTSARPINSLLTVNDLDTNQTETWSLIGGPFHGTASVSYSTLSTGALLTPVGLTYTPVFGYSGMDSFKVSISDGWFSDTTTIVVTILPATNNAGLIVGPDSICMTTQMAVNYTDSIAGGIWSLSNTTIAVISSTSGNVTSYAAGMDTVRYSVSGTCGAGTATKVIVIDPFITLLAIVGPTWVCTGDSVSMTDSYAGGLWGHDEIYSSVSTSGIVVGVSPGVDTITYSAANACGPASVSKPIHVLTAWQCDSALLVKNTIGARGQTISIFPNPAKGLVSIVNENGDPLGEITFYNNIGQVVYASKETTNSTQLDLNSFPGGVYLIKFNDGSNITYQKLVVY